MSGGRSTMVRTGAAANIVAAGAAAAAFAFTSPLFSSADEAAHVDYAYQVWSGHLPVFEEGLRIHPAFGFLPPVQWTAQHPPLYYLLQAPFVGPFADAGDYLAAGYAARAVNVAIVCALVAAVMWAAAAILPGRRAVWLTAGTVTAASPWVIRVGGSVYNDAFGALWATLVVGVTAVILRRGPSPRRVAALGATMALALSSRAALIVVVAACAGVVGLVLLLRRRLGAAAVVAAVTAAAVAVTAWFYVRNLRLTGSLLGGHPDWSEENLGRVQRPVTEVVTDWTTWRSLLSVYGNSVLSPWLVTAVLAAVPVAVAVCLYGARLVRSRPPRLSDLASATVVCAVPLAFVAMQLQYAAGGGGLNPRYLLPVVLSVSLAVSTALVAARRWTPVLLAAWLALAVGEFAAWVLRALPSAGLAGAETAPTFPGAAVVALVVAACAFVLALAAVSDTTARNRDERRTGRHRVPRPQPVEVA